METYCVSCKKYNVNENSSVRIAKQNRLMLLSNCAICGKKRITFIKKTNSAMLINLKWIK